MSPEDPCRVKEYGGGGTLGILSDRSEASKDISSECTCSLHSSEQRRRRSSQFSFKPLEERRKDVHVQSAQIYVPTGSSLVKWPVQSQLSGEMFHSHTDVSDDMMSTSADHRGIHSALEATRRALLNVSTDSRSPLANDDSMEDMMIHPSATTKTPNFSYNTRMMKVHEEDGMPLLSPPPKLQTEDESSSTLSTSSSFAPPPRIPPMLRPRMVSYNTPPPQRGSVPSIRVCTSSGQTVHHPSPPPPPRPPERWQRRERSLSAVSDSPHGPQDLIPRVPPPSPASLSSKPSVGRASLPRPLLRGGKPPELTSPYLMGGQHPPIHLSPHPLHNERWSAEENRRRRSSCSSPASQRRRSTAVTFALPSPPLLTSDNSSRPSGEPGGAARLNALSSAGSSSSTAEENLHSTPTAPQGGGTVWVKTTGGRVALISLPPPPTGRTQQEEDAGKIFYTTIAPTQLIAPPSPHMERKFSAAPSSPDQRHRKRMVTIMGERGKPTTGGPLPNTTVDQNTIPSVVPPIVGLQHKSTKKVVSINQPAPSAPPLNRQTSGHQQQIYYTKEGGEAIYVTPLQTTTTTVPNIRNAPLTKQRKMMRVVADTTAMNTVPPPIIHSFSTSIDPSRGLVAPTHSPYPPETAALAPRPYVIAPGHYLSHPTSHAKPALPFQLLPDWTARRDEQRQFSVRRSRAKSVQSRQSRKSTGGMSRASRKTTATGEKRSVSQHSKRSEGRRCCNRDSSFCRLGCCCCCGVPDSPPLTPTWPTIEAAKRSTSPSVSAVSRRSSKSRSSKRKSKVAHHEQPTVVMQAPQGQRDVQPTRPHHVAFAPPPVHYREAPSLGSQIVKRGRSRERRRKKK